MISSSAMYAGAAVGLAVAVPIGPMGLLCIQRTLVRGWSAGLITGLAAALVLTLWAGIMVLGAGHKAAVFAVSHSDYMSVCSGCLLLFFAIRILQRSSSSTVADHGVPPAPVFASLSTFFWGAIAVALVNPLTLVLLAAAIPAITPNIDTSLAPDLIFGVFLGSIAWWIVLSLTVTGIRRRFDARLISWINKFAGAILFAMAVMAVSSGFWRS